MSAAPPPEGWKEVFQGPCVRADLIHAVLESRGVRAVIQQYSPQAWWSGSVMEDCRVYVPLDQAEAARAALAETEESPEQG
jgi:hypothetical protein